MKHTRHLNRFAMLAIIPLVAVGFFVALRATDANRGATFEGNGVLVLANLRDESLTLFDYESGLRHEVALAGPPHEMVLAGERLYVTLGRSDAVAQVNLATREVERYLVLAGTPHGIASDGARLYITLDSADEVVQLDLDSLAEQARRPTGDTPHAIAVVGSTAIVTNAGEDSVSALGADVETRAAGVLPETIAIVDGRLVVAGNAGDGSLSLYSLPGLAILGNVDVGGRPVRVAGAGAKLLVSDGQLGRLLVLEPVEGGLEVVDRVVVGRLADGICASPDGRWVGTTANGDNRLVIIDAERWAVSAEFPTADGPGACLWLDSLAGS
jgi:DNA-binding beta-propeller fold protein YncE